MPAPQESKFILRAHRDDGRYAPDDPAFAAALHAAARSPELAAWLDAERSLDATVAQKLDGIAPPEGLRETILAGARASRLARRWWQNPLWLVAAASIAITATLAIVMHRAPRATGFEAELIAFAARDAGDPTHAHGSSTEAARVMFAALRDDTRPLTGGNAPGASAMANAGCKRFSLGGRDVYEVCVVRQGRWFHLYVTPREPAEPVRSSPTIAERGTITVASWSTPDSTYVLAGPAGREALQTLI